MKKVLVIGGGFAGLSAGVFLAEKGFSVTLIEYRKILGGRSYSVEDGPTGGLIDNGQHVLLGSFQETRRFLKTIGADHLVRFQNRMHLVMLHPGQKRINLSASFLPAPFHLAGSLFLNSEIPGKDRFRLLKSSLSITFKKNLPVTWTVKQWLDQMDQPETLRHHWWNPLTTSMLNEQPHKASADLFLKTLKNTFWQRNHHSSFGFIQTSLGDLYTEQARKFIQEKGGVVFLDTPVSRVLVSDDRVDGVVLRNGGVMTADAYISTVPYHVIRRLLPQELTGQGKPFGYLPSLRHSPIISTHLWFDRPVMEEELVCLVNSPIHQVVNKSRSWTEGEKNAGALACHTWAARNLIQRPKDVLVKMALRELARFFPMIEKAKLVHARLIKDRQATLSCTPEAECLRPDQKTPVQNFYLAGDWTKTGLPATIESAVLSGRRCADLIEQTK